MRRGKEKVRFSDASVKSEKKKKTESSRPKRSPMARKQPARIVDKDPLALPKTRKKPVPTKAARKETVEPEYEVEKIVGHQILSGKVSYCIRWKGYSSRDDTWEDEKALNCTEMLQKYQATMYPKSPKAPKSPKKMGRPKKGVAQGKVTKAKVATKTGKGRGRPKGNATPKRKSRADKEWEVEEVVAVRTTESGNEEFYIKWKGYDSEENTWEPAANVINCDAAIERFRQTQGGDAAAPQNGGEEEEPAATEESQNGAEDDQASKDATGDDEDDK